MSRKKQLLSIILSFCIVVASLGGITVSAADYNVEDGDSWTAVDTNVLYKYYKCGDIATFRNEDKLTATEVHFSVTVEGGNQAWYTPENPYTLTSDCIVSGYTPDTSSSPGALDLVSATANPQVFVATSATGDYVKLDVGPVSTMNGMARATVPES